LNGFALGCQIFIFQADPAQGDIKSAGIAFKVCSALFLPDHTGLLPDAGRCFLLL
jgi:hypothetical protein